MCRLRANTSATSSSHVRLPVARGESSTEPALGVDDLAQDRTPLVRRRHGHRPVQVRRGGVEVNHELLSDARAQAAAR